MTYQLGSLAAIARVAGHHMTHMSFHGALGNMVAADADMAAQLIRTVAAFDPEIIVSSSSSRAIETAASLNNLRVATTFLADRAYDDDCLLVPRKIANSVIKDPTAVLQRVRQLLEDGTVTSISGKVIKVSACSILLHGDTPGAVELALTVRNEIESAGGQIVPISQLMA
ncbi:LamB/YcsF family protein [Pseudomonas syringae]|nr:LamB/YcsF family protein [Pseudomonas syringae]